MGFRKTLVNPNEQYIAMQQASLVLNPRLRYGVKWIQDNISKDGSADKILLMGWASLRHKSHRSPIPGMFILTERKLCFVRDDSVMDAAGEAIQIYDIGKISDVEMYSGALAGLRRAAASATGNGKMQQYHTITFTVGNKQHTWGKIIKDSAKRIFGHLTKNACTGTSRDM